ncbi:MAG TPA: class III signal peptide-containing protein [Methanobacterium sp.]|nr:class III signal peptide-containing protein [Methanobacterium sp.]
MDKRGQISIEFVLIVAFMLMLVILIGVYAADANEKNVVSSAARSGVMDAASNLLLNNTIDQPLHVTDISTNDSGQNITLLIDVSGQFSNSTNTTLKSFALQSIQAQGYTLNNTNSSDPFVKTSRHNYRVTIV